jgi:hypothetical protein
LRFLAESFDGREDVICGFGSVRRLSGNCRNLNPSRSMLARWGIWRLGGRDFVRDIVAQFVADAAAVLASLTAAVASRDSKGFREQANALRSCAANVGAPNVYRMCLDGVILMRRKSPPPARSICKCSKPNSTAYVALTPMLQEGDGSGAGSEAT